MTYTYSDSVTLSALQCCNCGITFAVPEDWEANRRKDHNWFYCPNGHQQHFSQKTDAEKYKEMMEQRAREAASLRENYIAAQRAQQKAEKALVRLKKRSAAGVCTCCNRTVSQLADHMKSKHPEFRALQGLNEKKQLPEKVQ